MALVSVDEYNLVAAHREGDAAAFADIVKRYQPALTAHARRRLSDAYAAEDAVQEAYLRAYRALPAFDGDYRLGAWLHRIVDNVCNDQLDRRRRDEAIREKLEARADATDDIDVDALLARDETEHAWRHLSRDHRDALVQRFVEDRSYEEIASNFGVTQQAARARVSRARRALRRLFELPGASALALFGFARRISFRSSPAADAPTPRLGLASQLVATAGTPAAQSTTSLATKIVLATTATVAIAVPATEHFVNDASPIPRPPAVSVVDPASAPAAAGVATVADTTSSSDATATTVVDATTVPPATSSTASGSSSSDPSWQAPVVVPAVTPPSESSGSSTDAPPPAVVMQHGSLEGPSLEVTQAGPRYLVHGEASLVGDDGTTSPVTIDGKILLDESDPASIAVDGTLTLTTDDGRELRLSVSGTATRHADGDAIVYTLDAKYSLDGADRADLPSSGTLGGSLANNGDGTGALGFQLEGER